MLPWLHGETEAKEGEATYLACSLLVAEAGFELRVPGTTRLSLMLEDNDDGINLPGTCFAPMHSSHCWRSGASVPDSNKAPLAWDLPSSGKTEGKWVSNFRE